MRFYVPEWDDAVDSHYDFRHDELSTLDRQERDLDYIWDIFERDTTPIDGVLISREQVEETTRKADRLAEYGVYDDPVLSVPEWLPTISDCGAWGYKSLPFPPYGNAEMLDFYETLEVTVGVTIDHLVLGSGKDKGRLYLDERAFHTDFKKSDIPDALTDVVDLMVDEWPNEWPTYVEEYEPSICTQSKKEVEAFAPEDFQGDVDTVLARLARDPRAVYREDDAAFRYELTLRNAQEMYDLYHRGNYPFRLMVAIQGWNPETYIEATEEVLDIGYNYLGIGGVAGSPIHDVRQIVKGVGKTVKEFERENNTRIDSHVFGFAKSEGFETVGRSGMTSFDSASMLRSAWTGGQNYRLDNNERYDAIRVRYPSNRDSLAEAVEKSLRGRETLVALRAFDSEEPIVDALYEWQKKAEKVLPATREYLREHRHDEQYDASLLQEVETAFRDDFEYARELQASFSDNLRGKLVKLLRKDDPEDPVSFEEYSDLLTVAQQEFEPFPRMTTILENDDPETTCDAIWTVVRDYATWIGDEDLLEEYQRTLQNRPWEKCDCSICTENSIEVCIFRGNDRNRRRGFHNTRRFYDEFTDELPKILIGTRGTASLNGYETIEDYLRAEHPDFWQQVHDLPVAEVGVLDAGGVREWWDETPTGVSLARSRMAENLGQQAERYQKVFLHTPDGEIDEHIVDAVEESNCTIQTFQDPSKLRQNALEACGENYIAGDDFLPHPPKINVQDGLDILVIDQCSGSKDIPEGAPVFDDKETLQFSREELLERDNVPGINAKDLYTGRQQEFVKEAVRRLKGEGHDVERYFISAGFGLVSEDEPLPPYEVTFSSMGVADIRERSKQLSIQADLEQVLNESDYDVVFFTLGKDYYTSIDIDNMVQNVRSDRIGVVFNRELVDDQFDNIVSVPARTEDAKNHGTIVVGLKGHYMKNFAHRIDSVESLEPEAIEGLCRRVEEEPTQMAFEKY
ncbi:queuine tRNA-ribosyltransferase tRNA-guanine transglycosylase [Natrinema longum]|uniref:Queuine tRNA-ribosyltransferase tRNA-guanine transglycosylase n=1 Tax=Natrinema longum TaxID=370324 RepID=A0A8A2UC02_9EURY|nr:queuine tRNA-ribosyltransferase tRNA-guanine transglycosylase [Natrinema longum]MBZ6495807.1 queuine tRNA-ribosyltransferase tRNA-guanine transglycosylase [Natrinema longum]QSW86249.1 queuine tRNA-ribosyltransferase tRNA-guanine transglycosylase [Natrinema longum]